MKKVFLFLVFTVLWASDVPFETLPYGMQPPEMQPWFTGPLLAPTGSTMPPGHGNIEPYLFVVANTAKYNAKWKSEKIDTFWNNNIQFLGIFGLTNWMDIELIPTVYYNSTRNVSDCCFGDLPIGLNFQLFRKVAKVTEWNSALKLVVREILPLGKYQKLNPKKWKTDVGGQGSWQTVLGLVWGNLFYLGKDRFMSWRTNLQYTLPAPTHVKNLNRYGGGAGTRGTIYPGQNFLIDTAIEINLTRRWSFAMDVVGSWFTKTRFKGKTEAPNTLPSSIQISLAPAIEYNWNAQLGVIFGPWFTIAGRNSAKFRDAVFAINYF